MATILKESLLHKILTSGFNDEQLENLNNLFNGSQLKPTLISLIPHKSNSISDSNKGISYVSLELEENKNVTGFLCYKDNNNCALFSFINKQEEMCSIEIDPVNFKYLFKYEGLDIEEFRRELSDILISGGGSSIGVVIQANEDITLVSPNPSWTVPKLTVEQVTQAYNAVMAGKSCVITNEDGDVSYVVVLVDSLAEPSIVIQHYWMGFVDYQIHDSSDEVVITGHPFPTV